MHPRCANGLGSPFYGSSAIPADNSVPPSAGFPLNVLLIGSGLLLAANLAGMLRRRPGLEAFAGRLPAVNDAGHEAFFTTLSERLTARFGQGAAFHGPFSNWLLWLARLGPLRYAAIELTEDLFRYAATAQCHQIAQAFVDVATRKGQMARVVGLDGHVIAEAFYDDRWHAFDPDYGVILRREGQIMTIEELITSPTLADELYRGNRVGKNDLILPILARGRIVRSLPGEHLSPRTARWQRRMNVLKWLLPAAGLAVGVWLKWMAGAPA